jgi:hemerythrin
MTLNYAGLESNSVPEPSLLIGVPSIDKEHNALILQLNRLINQSEALPGSEAFSDILNKIGEQISEHFESEEGYFKSCGMPLNEVDEHIQAHNDILEQYCTLNLDLMVDKALSRSDILLMIKSWIFDHVLTYDIKIKKYVRSEKISSSSWPRIPSPWFE